MTCCNKKTSLDTIYLPISRRLVDFGKEVYGEEGMNKYKETFMWVFSFYETEEMCEECRFKFSAMSKWFVDYGLFKNVTRNVKWVLEDEPTKTGSNELTEKDPKDGKGKSSKQKINP